MLEQARFAVRPADRVDQHPACLALHRDARLELREAKASVAFDVGDQHGLRAGAAEIVNRDADEVPDLERRLVHVDNERVGGIGPEVTTASKRKRPDPDDDEAYPAFANDADPWKAHFAEIDAV